MMRRLLPVLGALLLALGLLTATGPTSSAVPASGADRVVARKAPPRQDYPRLPAYCASRQEKIPSKPVICKLNSFVDSRPTIVLWGDSHAWMMIPALKQAAKDRAVNLVAVVMGECPPMDPQLKSQDVPAPSCDKSNELAIAYTKQLQDGDQNLQVILGGSWQRYFHAQKVHDHHSYDGTQALQMQKQTPRLFRTLTAEGISVTVVGQVATVPETRKACSAGNEPYACDLPRHASLQDEKATRQYVLNFMRPLPGNPQPLNVNPSICNRQVCHGKIGAVRTWFDDLHLSATRSKRMASYLAPVVEKALAEPPASGSGSSGGGSGGSGCTTLPIFC